MQTDPSACHSPIGSFQRRCYLVSAPAATGQLLPSTGAPLVAARQLATSHDLSRYTADGTAAAAVASPSMPSSLSASRRDRPRPWDAATSPSPAAAPARADTGSRRWWRWRLAVGRRVPAPGTDPGCRERTARTACDRAEGRTHAQAGRPAEAARALRRALARFERLSVPFEAARTREHLAALEPPTAARPLLEAARSTYERLDCRPRQHAVQARLLALARPVRP
jgi:hypothetical protein